jgi:predicted dehydrogenase
LALCCWTTREALWQRECLAGIVVGHALSSTLDRQILDGTMSRMNVVVAGLGWWGKVLANSLSRSPRFKVAYVVDPRPPEDADAFARERGFTIKPDFDAMLADKSVDGVILTTPNALHEDQTIAAFGAGKAVFCEKPLTMTGAGAARMVAAADKAGKVLGIGHERRYEPAYEELCSIIASGAIGKLLTLEANVSHNQFQNLDKTNWRKDPKSMPAGLYTGTGIHQTDIFCSVAGQPIEVRAETATYVFDKPMEDYICARITFESGVRAMFSALSCSPFYGRFTAYGETGWVEIVSEANVDWGQPEHLIYSKEPGKREHRSFDPVDAVILNLIAWADANTGLREYRFTREHLIDNTRIFEAIVKSSQQNGTPVKL